MTIEGLFKFKKDIPLSNQCLGKKYIIKIGNFDAKLLTPLSKILDKNDDTELDKSLVQPKSCIMFNDTINWGEIYVLPSADARVKTLKIIIDIKTDILTEDIKKELKIETQKWIERFKMNLYGFGINFDTDRIKIIENNYDECEYYYLKDEKTTHIQINIPTLIIKFSEPINYLDFKSLIKNTSENKTLSIEYQLLKEANTELFNENYRKSILDSATAIEIALTNKLSNTLKIKNEGLEKEILKKFNSIPNKRNLLRHTGIILPDYNYQSDVEDLRNKAIHSGKKPNKEEALKAFKIAKEVVNLLVKNKFE